MRDWRDAYQGELKRKLKEQLATHSDAGDIVTEHPQKKMKQHGLHGLATVAVLVNDHLSRSQYTPISSRA